MRILIVDDEEGIREGLASFLRHHGHSVATAQSCAAAQAALQTERFDVLVSDWRLTDGNAKPLLHAGLPTIVITGCAEEVPEATAVLRKPILPGELLRELVARVPSLRPIPRPATPPLVEADVPGFGALPPDTCDRLRLLVQAVNAPFTVQDDGGFATVTFDLVGRSVPSMLLDSLGGDWWVGEQGGRQVGRWRCHRDGRPAGVDVVIGPRDAWPAAVPFGIDLHGHSLQPESFLTLLDVVSRARTEGREIHLLNVPSHLRLYAELLGRATDLPMRASSGPRLTATQRQLWS